MNSLLEIPQPGKMTADELIREQIRKFKSSAEASVRYLGHVLEAIAKLKHRPCENPGRLPCPIIHSQAPLP